MKKLHLLVAGVALAALAVFMVWFDQPVSAHEGREIGGKYDIELGWHDEPAYVGVTNNPEVFIHLHSNTGEEGKPVIGAEETLKLKVTFGKQTKQLKLDPVEGDPGHYIAHLTPTRPGDYVFQLTGTLSPTTEITDTATVSTSETISQSGALSMTETLTPTIVNETFTSAAGKFSTVEPASDVLFPDTKVDVVSLQSEIDTLKAQIKTLQDAVTTLQAAKK